MEVTVTKVFLSLLCLCLLVVLVMPVCGQVTTYTAPTDKAIWTVDISAPLGSTGTATFTQVNGVTTTATWSYTGYPLSTMQISIGGDSDSYNYIQPVVSIPMKMRVWNGDNVTYARQLKMGAGMYGGLWQKVVETTIEGSPISSYTVSSGSTVEVSHETITFQDAYEKLNPDTGIDWVKAIQEYLPVVWTIFESLFFWLKFLFIDNLVLTVSLYVLGSAAYAINTSRNIFVFYKTWFRQQAAFFRFIADGFSVVISIVTQVIGVVGGVVSSLISKILG